MLWLIAALCTAIFVASEDALIKWAFSDLDPYSMAAYPMLYSIPWFLAILPFIALPHLDQTFFWTFLLSLPLNGVCFLLYIRAIQIAPLSLTLPYLAFTPVFLLFTGFFFLGELPNLLGTGGVLMTVVGCYVLNIMPGRMRMLDPLRALGREKGSLLMLLVAFLFGFAAVLGKMAILHSSPLFFAVSFFGVHNLLVPLFLVVIGKLSIANLKKRPLLGLVSGGLFCGHVLCHSIAIAMTKAVYMISVKRLSILIGLIYGKLIFHEEHMLVRFTGAAMMVAGSVIILLFGTP